MNYAVPVYQCQRDTSSNKAPFYSCTVEIGGIRYIGAVTKTKKEAEIKVARTALLAIWLSKSESSMESVGTSELTVLPSKKRQSESNTHSEETANEPKPKRAACKKRVFKRKPYGEKAGQTRVQNVVPGEEGNASVKSMTAETMPQGPMSEDIRSDYEGSAQEHGFIPHANNVNYAEPGQLTT
jgi:hypothetical protein